LLGLALTRAVTDMASEKAFFTSYDACELNRMATEVEGRLRKSIQTARRGQIP
jgi:hypothetical protein